jgi:transcriptional regulator with XRE-family HTH domain
VSIVNDLFTLLAMRASRNTLLIQALATEIKARRNQLGLTQEDLAGASGLDRPYITLMEAARKQPTVSVFWRLAEGLRATPGELASAVQDRYEVLLAAQAHEPMPIGELIPE